MLEELAQGRSNRFERLLERSATLFDAGKESSLNAAIDCLVDFRGTQGELFCQRGVRLFDVRTKSQLQGNHYIVGLEYELFLLGHRWKGSTPFPIRE